jgi:hypothetical protein
MNPRDLGGMLIWRNKEDYYLNNQVTTLTNLGTIAPDNSPLSVSMSDFFSGGSWDMTFACRASYQDDTSLGSDYFLLLAGLDYSETFRVLARRQGAKITYGPLDWSCELTLAVPLAKNQVFWLCCGYSRASGTLFVRIYDAATRQQLAGTSVDDGGRLAAETRAELTWGAGTSLRLYSGFEDSAFGLPTFPGAVLYLTLCRDEVNLSDFSFVPHWDFVEDGPGSRVEPVDNTTVLVTGQTVGSLNGFYVLSPPTATRSALLPSGTRARGVMAFCPGSAWISLMPASATIGTSPPLWRRIS